MPSSEGISAEVRQNPNAIGYDGLGYVTADQKVLAVAAEAGRPYVLPSAATVLRRLLPDLPPAVHVHGRRARRGDRGLPATGSSGEGQALVIQELGFVPLADGTGGQEDR